MDDQLLARLAREFSGHDDMMALIMDVRARAWEVPLLETVTQEVSQAEAFLQTLQIPEGLPAGLEWQRLTLAARMQLLYERMLYHLRQAQAADQGRPMVAKAADAQDNTGSPCNDELAEVHALLDAYGVPRALFCVLGPDWRAQDVPARAAERLRNLHRLMVESGLPDFMPPGTVVEPPES